jgi:hypothetical protein
MCELSYGREAKRQDVQIDDAPQHNQQLLRLPCGRTYGLEKLQEAIGSQGSIGIVRQCWLPRSTNGRYRDKNLSTHADQQPLRSLSCDHGVGAGADK